MDVSKDRTQCEIEISNVSDLLSTLNYHVFDQPYSNEAWHLQVKALADGPMDQYMSALQKLHSKLILKLSIRNLFRSRLIWKSVEEDISHILSKVKRLKPLIQIAHEIDHLELSEALRDDTIIVTSIVTSRQDSQYSKFHRHHDVSHWLLPAEILSIGKRERFMKLPELTSWNQGMEQSLCYPSILQESNHSDTKSIALLKSHATLVPSLNPTDVGGAAEEFAEILWNSEGIQQCLKLGFALMDSNRFERNFLRFIKTYASELRAEADTTIQKSAAHIVYYFGAYITRIIRRRVVRGGHQATTALHSIREQNARKLTLERFLEQQKSTKNPNRADKRQEDAYFPNLEKLTDFLISSTAFTNFRTQLEFFVESNSRFQHTLEDSPHQSHIEKSDIHVPIEQLKDVGFFRRVRNFLRRSLRQPVPLESQRVEWICECGDLLHMDFDSNSRSFLTINSLLCSPSATLQPSGGSHASSRTLPRAISVPMPARLTGDTSRNSTTQADPAPGLLSNIRQPLIRTCYTASTVLARSNNKFLELCVNSGKFLKTLGEIDVSSVNTDGEFFSTVREHYLRLRSFRARFWLLKPVSVSYVRFSVEDRCRVGILHKPVALPPQIEVDEKRYHYDPCPLENELPISSDLFLHYLFSCSIPSRHLIWLPRIPRKLDHSIFASTAPVSYGWGVHIDEGPDYLKVFILNLVILGVSGAAAALWDIYRHDFQGAMGFAAWIIMLLNTLVAIFIAKWSQE
ncbi:hypothetical protein V501_03613 [Pseudogymnoascus sp. VKM F-4519 (FW-2642)]|nr:hypothetical protein V501_03613 [Pseudogymnoascus sp. VKM F-4519 (FW-2642)]